MTAVVEWLGEIVYNLKRTIVFSFVCRLEL
jgi:hypothetical protein